MIKLQPFVSASLYLILIWQKGLTITEILKRLNILFCVSYFLHTESLKHSCLRGRKMSLKAKV